jgi:hypothetical protein
MPSIISMLRGLDLNDLSKNSWNAELKKLHWRFMFELNVPPSKIEPYIASGYPPIANKLVDNYLALYAIQRLVSK